MGFFKEVENEGKVLRIQGLFGFQLAVGGTWSIYGCRFRLHGF